jgi:phosphotransferase system enzyme I (PtsI)
MSILLQGLVVTRGTAVGRAVLFESGRIPVTHALIEAHQVETELARLRAARAAAVAELEHLRADIPAGAPIELAALLDVHLLLLQDDAMTDGVRRRITEQHNNAEWALVTELEEFTRRFDQMQDSYLRERKPDIEQVVERVLQQLQAGRRGAARSEAPAPQADEWPAILVAHDLSPADLLQLAKNRFAGFVIDAGGQASHTAIVARSLDLPAVLGARSASRLVRAGDLLVIDGNAGSVIVDPPAAVLSDFVARQRREVQQRQVLARLKKTPAVTLDGEAVELLANIEQPDDVAGALESGAAGIGLFRSEFLFMDAAAPEPDEERQYAFYARAVEALHGLPMTIRTVDLGADKTPAGSGVEPESNPALGVRGIRRSLLQPDVFLMQLRALLRAAALGPVRVLIPMVSHVQQIRQVRDLLARACGQLEASGRAHGPVKLGAMIEVPAAALALPLFQRAFDFLSIGTNDLIQYTLAVDRSEESVAGLYDPLHPAVLRLLASTIGACRQSKHEITVCGELAGDPDWTDLLLGMGLRSFSMNPARLLAVKQKIRQADCRQLERWVQRVLESDDPAAAVSAHLKHASVALRSAA